MSLKPPMNLRLDQEAPQPFEDNGPSEILIDDADPEQPKKETDDKGNVISIEFPDGSVEVSLDGSSLEEKESDNPEGWFDNLALKIPETELSLIADDLLRQIENDITSRKEWVEDRANGIKLLGLRVEVPGVQGGSVDSAPVEGMSRVRHPLLLEAVLRFQANARSELLPTDGPVKIREDNNNANLQSDELANDLQNDLNHFLTSTATEYYPDTDRMLFMLGFGGSAFKKVYFCPLRNRPVSESVDANDLIVNNSATDLASARRVTHRISMPPSTVKRMQILGVYRDVSLGDAKAPERDAVKEEQASVQGIKIDNMRADDNDREIYECYCELDIVGFEHKHKNKPSGLAIPYCVTIDVSSRQVLSVVRNYDEDSKELPVARQRFVKYPFVPGLGFYDIGLLHILGNTTNAVTAAWRELLDAGMYANFPGFLISDAASRQNTNTFRIPPGGGAQVKTGGQPIQQAVMPLPYKEPSGALMSLVENMVQTGQRVGGTAEQAVGEGKKDAPVGTTLALIDQATKILNSVHKRLHNAQAQEFELLIECFRENPESFWQGNKKPAREWDQETFLRALDQIDLVPQADPNTSSQTQRIMKVTALKQLASASPSLYDPIAVDTAALQAIGWGNPEQFFLPEAARSQPPIQLQQMQAEMAIKKRDSDAKVMTAQSRMLDAKARMQGAMADGQPQGADQLKIAELQLKNRDLDLRQRQAELDDKNNYLNRSTDLHLERMRLTGQVMTNERQNQHDLIEQAKEHVHEIDMQDRKNFHEHVMRAEEASDENSAQDKLEGKDGK